MSGRLRGLLQHRWAVPVLAGAGALAAAVATGLIGGWDWTKFWQDMVKNVFLAFLLAVATDGIKRHQERQRRRSAAAALLAARDPLLRLTIGGWSHPGGGDFKGREEPLDQAARLRAQELESFRVALVRAADCPNPSCPDPRKSKGDCQEGDSCRKDHQFGAWHAVTILRWPLASHLAEGRRHRLRDYLPRLHAELLALETHLDGERAEQAAEARLQTINVLGCMDHTDSTIMEHTLVEPSTAISTQEPPATWALFREAPDLPAAAAAHDPCYLLLHHIQHSLPTQNDVGIDKARAAVAALWLGKFRRCLHALQREVDAQLELIDLIVALVPPQQQDAGAALAPA